MIGILLLFFFNAEGHRKFQMLYSGYMDNFEAILDLDFLELSLV